MGTSSEVPPHARGGSPPMYDASGDAIWGRPLRYHPRRVRPLSLCRKRTFAPSFHNQNITPLLCETLPNAPSRGMILVVCLKKGLLIVFEGIDGAGKSTQARLLLRKVRAIGCEAISFREPTRGKWGRAIKRMAKTAGSLTPEEELDLFIKDRKENVRNNIKPALSGRKVVILDRYYYSTIAYQGAK